MASGVRQELAQLMNSTGSHKDLVGKCVLRPGFYFLLSILSDFWVMLIFDSAVQKDKAIS